MSRLILGELYLTRQTEAVHYIALGVYGMLFVGLLVWSVMDRRAERAQQGELKPMTMSHVGRTLSIGLFVTSILAALGIVVRLGLDLGAHVILEFIHHMWSWAALSCAVYGAGWLVLRHLRAWWSLCKRDPYSAGVTTMVGLVISGGSIFMFLSVKVLLHHKAPEVYEEFQKTLSHTPQSTSIRGITSKLTFDTDPDEDI